MGGFEDGERYRGQQTQLSFIEDADLSIRDQPEVKIPAVPPQTKKPSKPALPVRIHFMAGHYVNEHHYFYCQGYRPYGGDPDYHEKHSKYHNNSDTCARCFKVIDGVPYRASFTCRKEGGGHTVYHSLFNQNPLDHVDPRERKMITAGLKWLWQEEGGKHVRRTKTKESK